MTIDDAGIGFTKQQEGYAPRPMNDNGHVAWGHGHDQQPGETPPTFISPLDAEALLRKDYATRFEPAVNHLIPASCSQNQYNALCDFCYNEGVKNFATMMHHGWDQIPVQILAWCWQHVDGIPVKSAGLLARRQAELSLFST